MRDRRSGVNKGPWSVGLLTVVLGAALFLLGVPEVVCLVVIVLGMALVVWAGGGTGFGA